MKQAVSLGKQPGANVNYSTFISLVNYPIYRVAFSSAEGTGGIVGAPLSWMRGAARCCRAGRWVLPPPAAGLCGAGGDLVPGKRSTGGGSQSPHCCKENADVSAVGAVTHSEWARTCMISSYSVM